MDLEVVTVTAICKIDGVQDINSSKLFHAMHVDDKGNGRVPFVEFSTSRVRVSKGVFLINKKNQLRYQPHKFPAVGNKEPIGGSGFRHMLTMLVRVNSQNHRAYVVNVKVFKNGNVQMTGLKTPEDGQVVADTIAEVMADAVAEDPQVAIVSPKGIVAKDCKVCMINGIFAVSFSIDRQKTHDMFLGQGMHSMYDPMLYHAVKLRVPHPVEQKKMSGTHKTCATIAVFQTGSAIITGCTSMDELRSLHKKIKNILEMNVKTIQRVEWRIVRP